MTIPKLVSTAALAFAFMAHGQSTLAVHGIDGKSVSLSGSDLSALPVMTVKAADHGKQAVFEGPLLCDVLKKVAAPLGEKFHSTAASYYVVVEAKDGYRAVFAWAEIDEGFTGKTVLLAFKRDGRPLAGDAAPFQMVAPDDKRGGRWVRQVTALRIEQAGK